MSNMRRYFCIVGILLLASVIESQTQRRFRRPSYKYFAPSDVPESIDQRLFPGSYAESPRSLYRNPPKEREVEEVRPLCEEERKSQSIWELIYTSASGFLQTSNELDLRKYNLIPTKVDVIQCITRKSDEPSGAVCKPENCRERKDIEVFGRLKNETRNVWEFVGTLSSIPVACECFVRLKPEKCLRSVDVFADF